LLVLGAVAQSVGAAPDGYATVRPGTALQFPRDAGSHPRFRNEWWYITGWLKAQDGSELGMQITFFRNRPGIAEDSASGFAPQQLLFAHAALSDPKSGRLLHDQRAARAGFGLAEARVGGTDVAIEDWSLKGDGSAYAAEVTAREFRYSLRFAPTQAPLLQGERGFSRKGPLPLQASYYYSQPHLAVSGSVMLGGTERSVSGEAWLDHEWSSEALPEGAVGWDWIGLNLEGGGALMAFRMRTADGGSLWAGGSIRGPDGRVRALKPSEVHFSPQRRWRSPRTGAEYPVAMRVQAGPIAVELEPLMDDQELDARASTGTVYWEGAVRVRQAGKPTGRGYLELTGYWKPLKL
jgi:predicted secreted hydrolase